MTDTMTRLHSELTQAGAALIQKVEKLYGKSPDLIPEVTRMIEILGDISRETQAPTLVVAQQPRAESHDSNPHQPRPATHDTKKHKKR